MTKKPLVIISGPTAVGKSDLSIRLAKAINGEIISADSMQVYKGMDIGTAKITTEEMQGIKHHLIDVLDPLEAFNVSLFKDMALKAIDEIYANNRIPIIVGGTGFYIQALLYDIDFTSHEEDQAYQEYLDDFYEKNGEDELHKLLISVDPESAESIHKNNIKRVMRALNYYHLTGEKFSLHNSTQRQNESPYNFAYFVLNDDRKVVYDRIDKRVDIMFDMGLLEEVKALKDQGYTKELVSMQGLGYKEVLDYLDIKEKSEEDYNSMVNLLKQSTRHFAKRQLTWFRREKEVVWVNKNEFGRDEDRMLSFMLDILKEKDIY